METQTQMRVNGASFNHPTSTPIKETITPAKAAHWLSVETNQRRLVAKHVERLAETIKAGRWDSENGETIKISTAGAVIDGQHRLQAIVEAGEPVVCLVVYGVPESSFSTIDTGRPRRHSDVLSIAGHVNVTALASAIKFVMIYEHGVNNPSLAAISIDSQIRPTPEQVLDFAQKNSDILEDVRVGSRFNKIANTSAVAAARYVIAQNNTAEDVDAFFDRMFSGAELSVGDPILALRNYLQSLRGRNVTRSSLVQFIAILRAWNHHKSAIAMNRISVDLSQRMLTVK